MADTDDAPPTRANGSGGSQSTAAPASRARRSAAASSRGRSARASRTVEAEADTLQNQVTQLQSDLKSIATTLSRMGQTGATELKANASARADDLAARGQSALDYAHDEFGAFEKQIKDIIREKPLTAVAGAVALGFVLAVITR